jgi:hypothetical protein
MPLGDSISDGFVGIAVGNTQQANGGYRVELFRQAIADGHDITFVGTRPANGPNDVDGQPFPRAHEGISTQATASWPTTQPFPPWCRSAWTRANT